MADFSVVFKLIEDESPVVIGGLQLYDDVRECSDIGELVRFSEALKETEPLSFLMGLRSKLVIEELSSARVRGCPPSRLRDVGTKR